MTDTDKWKKKFIRGLDSSYKLLWIYLMDDCNHAGIWDVDIDVARIRTGVIFDEDIAIQKFKGRVIPFDEGDKWFIPDFIHFQYGVLSESNRVHNSVIENLDKYSLRQYLELEKNKGLSKGLASPLERVKDKDKDKDKVILLKKELLSSTDFLESQYKRIKVKPDKGLELLNNFWNINYESNLDGTETLKDTRKHFSNWLNKQDLSTPAHKRREDMTKEELNKDLLNNW